MTPELVGYGCLLLSAGAATAWLVLEIRTEIRRAHVRRELRKIHRQAYLASRPLHRDRSAA